MQASLAIVPRRHWGVVRGYAALHLLAMYLGVVAGLPGLPVHRYLPHGARHALRLLGLWAPRPAAMLPVLVAMLLVGRGCMVLGALLGMWTCRCCLMSDNVASLLFCNAVG